MSLYGSNFREKGTQEENYISIIGTSQPEPNPINMSSSLKGRFQFRVLFNFDLRK